MKINDYAEFYEFTKTEIQWIAETVQEYDYDDHIGEYILRFYIIDMIDDDDNKIFSQIWEKITLEKDFDDYFTSKEQKHRLEDLFSEIFLAVEYEESNRIIREKYRRG